MTEQDYRSEIEYIYTRFPSFQRVGKVAYKPGIQTMQYLDNVMGNPHKNFLSIHVAGTNGKGSTSHMLASALMQLSPREFYEALLQNIPDLAEKYPAATQAMSRNGIVVPKYMMGEEGQGSIGAFSAGKSSAISNGSGLCADKSGEGSSKELNSEEGYSNAVSGKFLKVGLYTSPHLWDFRERIKVSEGNSPDSMKMVEKEYVYNFLKQYRPLFEEQNASFFEITTALAFKYFQEQKVDIAIIECGLGGRLDSTNIITPLLSIITNIGLDHCEHLGYEYTQIAAEKAGIIKEKVPVIIGELGTEKPSESQPSDWKILVPYKLKSSTFYGSLQLYSQNEQINNKILSAVAGSLFCCAMNDTTSIKKVFIEKAIAMRAPIIFAEYPDRLSLKKSRVLSGGFDLSEMDLGGDCQKKNIKAVIIAMSRLLNGAKYDCGCWKLARHPLVEYNAALKAKCCELALSKLSNNEVDLNMLAASDSIKPGNIDLLSTYNLLINRGTPATAMQGGDTSSTAMQNGDTSAAMQGGPAAHISSGRLQGGDTSESMQNGDTSSTAMQGGCASSFGMQNGDTSAAMQGGEPTAQISSGRLQGVDTSESMQNGDTSSTAMQGGCASSAAMQGGEPTAQISSGRLQGVDTSESMQNGDTATGMQGGDTSERPGGDTSSSAGMQGGCASSFGMQGGDASERPGGDTSSSAAMQGGCASSFGMQNGDASSAAMQGGDASSERPGGDASSSAAMQGGDASERPGGDTSSSAAMQGGCASSFGMQNGDTSAAMQGGPAAQNAGQDYNADHNRNIEQQCNILSDKNVEIILNAAERADNLKQQRFAALIPQLKRGIDNAAHITGLHGRWEHLFVNQTGALTTDPLTNTSKSDSGTEPFIYNVWKNIEIVCDTGHNAHGFSISAPQIIRRVTEQSEKPRRLIMIFGVVADKDLDSIIPILPNHYKKESHTAGFPNEQKNESHIAGFLNEQKNGLQAYYYFVNAAGSRALPAEKLAAKMFANGFKGEIVSPDSPEESSVMKAVDKYLHEGARPGDFLFIGGSSYVVAELKVK